MQYLKSNLKYYIIILKGFCCPPFFHQIFHQNPADPYKIKLPKENQDYKQINILIP